MDLLNPDVMAFALGICVLEMLNFPANVKPLEAEVKSSRNEPGFACLVTSACFSAFAGTTVAFWMLPKISAWKKDDLGIILSSVIDLEEVNLSLGIRCYYILICKSRIMLPYHCTEVVHVYKTRVSILRQKMLEKLKSL